MLTFSDDNMIWSTDYKPISDTSQQVEEEIEIGFETDKNYIVIVTVMSDYGNFTSKRSFSKSKYTWLSLTPVWVLQRQCCSDQSTAAPGVICTVLRVHGAYL